MKKELFCAFVLYLTSRTFPPTLSLNDRRFLKSKAKHLRFNKDQLFCGGRRILLSDKTKKHLRDLYEKQGHLNVSDLHYYARNIFIVPYLRFECAEIVANCSTAADSRIPVRRTGPMVYCSKKKRKILCR